MRRRTVAIVAILLCVATATFFGLFFGLKKGAQTEQLTAEPPAADIERVCSDRALSRASCEQLKFEWDASKRNAVSSCDAENADADARLECVAKRMTRLGSAADLFASSGSAVYPENYHALRMRVDSQYVCESGGALVVGGTTPVLVRFAKRGSEWSIETPDSSRVVVVSESGALALVPRGTVAARFVAGGTVYPSSITLSPVSRDGSALRSVAGSSVEVRLERALNGLLVEVKLTAEELSTFEYAANVSAIDIINRSGCCVDIAGKCSGASAAAQKQRFPLCCGCVDSDPRWCAWKASADASVVEEGELSRLCCSTRQRMFDVGPDYGECAKGTNLPGQYSKCDPSEEHTFTFVPAGAWALAPNGVRIPAFGRVAFMRTVGAGYRGVRCT